MTVRGLFTRTLTPPRLTVPYGLTCARAFWTLSRVSTTRIFKFWMGSLET